MADTGGKDWRRALLLGSAAALAVTLVVTTVALWDRFTCGGPGNGVRETGGQCVGVTDGSHVFHEDFTDVQELIRQENERVDALPDSTPVVRIAFLGILTFDRVSPMDPERMRRSLEGAYTAVMRANHTRDFADPTPQIQLVLANIGSQQRQWEPVVDELVAMSRDEDRPLVAVTGMGVSIQSTREAAARLNENDIPMVSSALTADGLAHGPGGLDDAGAEGEPALPGVIRVLPSNTEYVRALDAYLDGLSEPVRALIVHDRTEPDLFVSTLYEAYQEQLHDHIDGSTQQYDGTTVGDAPVSGLFHDVTQNVCGAGVDTILFAGRSPDLDEFLVALASNRCGGSRPLRILFVATGLSVLGDEETMALLAENDISLVYASGTDTRWETAAPASDAVPPGYPDFRDAYLEYAPAARVDGLGNGYALVTHDAVAVAAHAVRMTNGLGAEGSTPTPAEVRARMMLLNSAHDVRAGGGTLTYSPEGAGEATGRYVPIVELPMTDGEEPLPDPHVVGDG
ncbi:hypothetical protein ACWFMI_09520 [Nocardiopsis terrae]